MTLQTLRITDAIVLDAIQTDRFKTGVLTLTLTLPLTPLRAAQNILLTGIMRRGTQRYPSLTAINRHLDSLYATEVEIRSSKLGGNLLLTFTAELLDDRFIRSDIDILDGVIDTLAEILLHPLSRDGAFDEDTVQQEIRFALDALDAEINNTRSYSVTRCTELMYRDNALFPTVSALKETMKTTDARTLYEHYRELLSLAAMKVFYIGSAPIHRVATSLQQAFDSYTGGVRFAPTLPAAAQPTAHCIQNEKMSVAQGKLAMGFRTGISMAESPRYHIGLVLNEILGGSPASKLFLNVREKMSLCYYCSSSYSVFTGDMMVSSGMEVKNRKRVREAVLTQLADIADGKISETEWEAAKRSLENCYRQIYDSPLDLSSFYGVRHLFDISETVEDCRSAIAAVSCQEVISQAQKTVNDTEFFIEGTLTETEDCDDD